MKALSIHEPYSCGLVELPDTFPELGYAVLRPIMNGICGSDLNTYRGRNVYVTYPRTPGHEIAAEIVSIPENTRGLTPGMLVTCNPYFNCGDCYSCQRGLLNCCQNNETMGVQRDGAMKDKISMPLQRIISGECLDPRHLALVEPFSIAWHGVKKSKIHSGNNVLVIGAGTIGIFAAISAKQFGARVFVSDISEEKLDFVDANFGIDGVFLNDSDAHFKEQVRYHTNNQGFDVAIEAVGNPMTFKACIDAAAYCGTVIQIGISDKNVNFNFTMIQKKELSIFGSRNALNEDFEEVIKLFGQRTALRLSSMISAVFPFKKASEAFAYLDANALTTFKVMVEH